MEREIVEFSQNLDNQFLYTRNVENLRTRIQELRGKQEGVKERVHDADRKRKAIQRSVQNWLSRADDICGQAESFLNDVEGHVKARCSFGSVPSLAIQNRLSSEANEMVGAVSGLLDESKFHVFRVEEAFESRKPLLEEIMESLRDPNVSVIGICGMGGIGKTTFAKEVNRQVDEKKLFSEVVMTCVSQTPDIEAIQRVIKKCLKRVGRRPNLRRNRIKGEESVLLILDDIWENLDLLSTFEPAQKECKMVLISRSVDIVHSMGAEKIFGLEVLSFSESIFLFNKIVGNIIEKPDFRSCGLEIVKECAGVPLAIEMLAQGLKDKPLLDWKHALLQLKQSNPTAIEGAYDKVYSCILTSYKFLRSREAELLLLCSLHEEDQDIKVENLLRYSVGWGLFQEVHTLEEARNKVKIIVDKLKSCCLLLDGSCPETVTMNKVVRYVATVIASEDNHMHYIPNVARLEECMEEGRLKESKAISLLEYDDFCRLHEGLACPELEFFLMLHTFGSFPIPDSFFEGARGIRSLSLNGAWLESLHSSFYLLQNLETLCLCSCDLKDIDVIGELKFLRILDLSESTIEELPETIGQLTRLQLLDLRGCRHLQVVKKNVLSKLVQLEELYMAEEYDNWEVEGVNVERSNAARLVELKSLQKLTVLWLKIPDANILPKDLFSGKLERYRISVGGKWTLDGAGISRSLNLKLDERSKLKELGLELLMKRSEELALDGFMDLKNVVFERDDEKDFPLIKRLHFQDNNIVQYMVGVDLASDVFLSLESLYLRNLYNLERVCQGEVTTDSFKGLREVRVNNCRGLKNLFPLFIVKRLHYIQVEDCEMLEGIAEAAVYGTNTNMAEVLELRCLTLKYLPWLTEFCLPSSSSEFENLFSEKVYFPKLEELTLHGLHVENLWPLKLQSSTSYSLQNLRSLHVEECDRLSYLLPISIAKSLVQLKELRIRGCERMEILVRTEEEDQRLEDISFCKLETLELYNLPCLWTFCEAACFNCPSLSKLTIMYCEELDVINFHRWRYPSFAGDEIRKDEYFESEVAFPNLVELNIECCDYTVSNIFQSRNLAALLIMQTLTSLNVKRCHDLGYLMPSSAAKGLVQLKHLGIIDCCRMETVVELTFEEEERFQNITMFPTLESLGLTDLPNLKSVCEDCKVQLPSLLKLTVTHCPRLKALVTPSMRMQLSDDDRVLEEVDMKLARHLFDETGALMFPARLEELNLSRMNVAKLWVDQSPFSNPCVQDLTSLVVGNCHKLKFLFSSTVVGCLVRLKQLRVYECEIMEEVLVTKEAAEGSLDDVSLPKLESLELCNLPNLIRFCAEACSINCPSLLKLNIEECPNLVSVVLSPTSTQITLQNQPDEEMDLLPGKSLQRMVTLDLEN